MTVSTRKLKGEIPFPTEAASAKARLAELTSGQTATARCIATSWDIGIEVAVVSMRLVGEKEDLPIAPLTKTLPADIDDPDIARRLLGAEVPPAELAVHADYITRMCLLLLERRVPDNSPRTTFFVAAVAPYLYELCRIALGACKLTPQMWALSELAYGVEPRFPQDTDEWKQQIDVWRKRSIGDKKIPLSKLREDVEAALSAVRALRQRN